MMVEATTSPPRVTNIVFKIKISDVISKLNSSPIREELQFAHHNNFHVVKGIRHLTLIVFSKSGHVNVTGVRGFHQVRDILNLLSDVLRDPSLREEETFRNVSIVSSTATGALNESVQIVRLLQSYHEPTDPLNLTIQRGHFPSLLIRRSDQKGCVQLFCNGRFNIVGCVSAGDIDRSWRSVLALTRT